VDLEQLIEIERLKITSDSYQMSIGELASLYERGELTIDPDFQREFRWDYSQKVTFIESILFQFPLPSVFVASRPDGTWDLLDGLQRLSTVFEFIGILHDADGGLVKPLSLAATERLPDLRGVHFSGDFGEPALSDRIQRDFKRSRMDVKIILRQSDEEMLYELFTRLNTGGTQLTSQDVRNALINRHEQAFRKYLDDLASDEHYQKAISLSDNDRKQRYDYELLLVFLVATNDSAEDLLGISNLDETLTMLAKRTSRLYEYDREESAKLFRRVFRTLAAELGANAFEPRPPAAPLPGGFSRDAFVAITSACATAIREKSTGTLVAAIAAYWSLDATPASFPAQVMWGREFFMNALTD
jgi:hypothetical protein